MAANPSEITSMSLTAAETRVFHFKVESYSWARQVADVGQCFQSETFRVGGCEWAVRYYPYGYNVRSRSPPSIRLVLESLPAGVNKTTVRFGCVQVQDDDEYPWESSNESLHMCSPQRIVDFREARGFELPMDHRRLEADGEERDCFEVLCKVCVLRDPVTPYSYYGFGY
ncbi:unnamed protein product [Urochloa humidicola]